MAKHDCIWCPTDVRNLFALAQNVVANRDNFPRMLDKISRMKEALDRYQVEVDSHFKALRNELPPPPPIALSLSSCQTAVQDSDHACDVAPAGTHPEATSVDPGSRQ